MASFQGTFNTVCSKPTTPYHFVDSGDIRGTMDILWPSITALLLCTYSIQHLAVPYLREPENWKDRLWISFFSVARKPMHMLLALVVPEVMVGLALVDYLSARSSEKEMQKWALQDGAEWSLTHAFYANIGGFVVRFPSSSLPRSHEGELPRRSPPNSDIEANRSLSDSTTASSKESNPNQPIKPSDMTVKTADTEGQALPQKQQRGRHWCPLRPAYCPCQNKETSSTFEYIALEDIRAHGYTFRNGRFRINPLNIKKIPPDTDSSHISRALCDYANRKTATPIGFMSLIEKVDRFVFQSWVLDARQLLMARELGIIEKLPSYSTADLNDQSRGNALVKLISMGQIIYIVMQLCLRKAQALPSSQLEVMVVAFAACALVTYAFLLSKPQDVKVPRYVEAARFPTSTELGKLALVAPLNPPMSIHAKMGMTTLSIHHCERTNGAMVAGRRFTWGSVIGSAIFGSIHCAAWNFEFPTRTEQLLWRIACLVIVILPLPMLATFGRSENYVLRKFQDTNIEQKRDIQQDLAVLRGVVNFAIVVMGFIYFLCRLFMLAEVVRALFYLPPGAFLTANWLTSIPHIS